MTTSDLAKAAAPTGWLAAALLAAACTSPSPRESPEALYDPKSCAGCHPDHYREWSGSMHAYASTDPVFRAMNVRGQRDTHGDLGDNCVTCHAPLAVELGLTNSGLDLAEVRR